jgi:hypothetical protein
LSRHDTDNPFVGPRPFEEREDARFFAREREIQALYSLVVSHKAVLLYAASGVGKSSLLAAGLTPALRRAGFEVMRPVRFARLTRETGNVLVATALDTWGRDGATPADTIAGFLEMRPHPTLDDGFEAPRALVFDQFEEVFTQHPERGAHRDELIEQLAEALARDPLLRVLLVLREEYLAHFEDLAARRLDGVRARLRLSRLEAGRAFEAVSRPLAATGVAFADGVAQALIVDLLGDGDYVEPVQLQVVCSSIWTSLEDDATEITHDDVAKYGGVDETLERYYEEAVAAAAGAASMPEGRLRDELQQELITPGGTRGTIYGGGGAVPAAALAELERRHVARSYDRGGEPWFELAHDRLIEPVRESNAKFSARRDRARNRTRLAFAGAGFAVLIVALVVALVELNRTQQKADAASAAARGGAARAAAPPPQPRDSRLLLTLHPAGTRAIAFAAQGQVIATGAPDGSVTLWNTDSGFRAPPLPLFKHGAVTALAASGSGPIVAGSATGQLAVQRVDIPSKPVLLEPGVGPIRQVTAADDGNLVGAVGRDGVAVVDWQKHRTVFRLADGGRTLAVHLVGDAVETVGSDGRRREYRVGRTRPLAAPHLRSGPAVAAIYDAFGGLTLVRADQSVGIWFRLDRRAHAAPAAGTAGPDDSVAAAGGFVAVGGADGVARVIDAGSGKLVARFDTRRPPVRAVALDAIGFRLVTVGGDGTVHEWSIGAGSARVVGIARGEIGAPYVYGGTTPDGFDSSGLAQWVYARVGVSISRNLQVQASAGTAVHGPRRTGDLLFFKAGGVVIHVGIYDHGGKFLHADPTDKVVEVSSLHSEPYASQYAFARRVLKTKAPKLATAAAPAPTPYAAAHARG